MSEKQGFSMLVVILPLGMVILFGIGIYFTYQSSLNSAGPQLTACTEEAKICPDGSAVGRTGPNCEFAECPAITGDINNTIICTQDVKQCPDGSYVPRTGPNCEFAPCPQ